MRDALYNAAALCDAIAREIAAANTYGRGRVTRSGRQMEVIANRCGDQIWAMRNKVEVPDETHPRGEAQS
jgi:hypothetical protein